MRFRLKTPDGQSLSGFSFFWGKRVLGFNPNRHCAESLLGDWLRFTRPTMMPGEHEMPEGDLFYLCGVATAGYSGNFHMPIRRIEGAESTLRTSTGAEVTVEGGHLLEIPPLPMDWNGYGREFTTCRNFQWGVATFGYPSEVDGKAVTRLRRLERQAKRAAAKPQRGLFG